MISAYAISGKVWLVATREVAQADVPATLPIGSVVLTPAEAVALYKQLTEATIQVTT